MAKMMRAGVVHAFGKPLTIEEIPIPTPRPGEVLIKVVASGVCHTDLHAAEGDWPAKPSLPFVPGHEGVGIIAACGSGAVGLKEGDRAGVAWLEPGVLRPQRRKDRRPSGADDVRPCSMSSYNCLPLVKSMSAFGALQTVNDRRYPWAWFRQKAEPNSALAVFLAVAIVVGLVLPALGDERPSDPFGNHTAELNKDAPLVGIWDSLKDKMQLEKAYFHECLLLKEPPCPSISTLVQKLDEIRQYRGKALLGHLNLSVNLMLKFAPGEWTPPLETITMRHGDCKAYSLAKYAGAQELGVSADHVRLVIVHNRRHGEDHMVAAVHQEGEWLILDNLTNVLLHDWEKADYEPLAVLDYRGARRYLSAPRGRLAE